MTEFLGRQDCIESLRRDLVDLQGAVLDVFSRTGPVRVSSWKFPDKNSCNLDMVDLLEQYDFVEGENAFNQHSHIVLLELVIDRLLLLVQSFNAFVEQIRCSSMRENIQQKGCLSIGLVVRSYWSNLAQVANVKVCRHCSSACSSTSSLKSVPQINTPSSPNPSSPCSPKADSRSVGCQTFASSLAPCDACHQVQCSLRKTGDALVGLFRTEGLPSSLQPFLEAVEETLELGQMTAGDVVQWANEQHRDMQRLAKHLEDVRGTVQPLRDRAEAAETERDRFRSQLRRAQKEFKDKVEKEQSNAVQLEFSLRDAQRSVTELKQKLHEQQQQQQLLRREIVCLEESNCSLKARVTAQEDKLQTLERERSELQEEVRLLHTEEEVCSKLQQRVQQLEGDISDSQLQLNKANARYQSACRQQESMQAKQQALSKRVDALDEECEELQRQLAESEEEQSGLHKQLQLTSEEKEEVQARLGQQQELCSQLQKEKQKLERHVGRLQSSEAEVTEYVQTLKKRERLLVAFPELSPLAKAQPQSTGNVLLDMEQQLQANSIRIKVLEQENMSLHSSLEKLREKAQHDAFRISPLQAWSHSETEQMQRSPVAARRGYGSSVQGESALESEDHMSSTTTSASSLQPHVKTLHLNWGSTAAAKRHTHTPRDALLSRSRRRK